VKLSPGGLVEVEFIAQALQLHHAPRHPEVLATTTRIAIANLAKISALDSAEAEGLIAAERLWRGISGILRLTLGPWREDTLPEPAASGVLRVAAPLCPKRPVDLPGLRAQMEESASLVRKVFEARLGRLDQGDRK
jgi:glutamate-ammonia-ligase adenylyltransferase